MNKSSLQPAVLTPTRDIEAADDADDEDHEDPCADLFEELQLSPCRLKEILDSALLEATGADKSELGRLRFEMNRKIEAILAKEQSMR